MVATTLDQYINTQTKVENPIKENEFINELTSININHYNYITTPQIVEKVDTDTLMTKEIAKLIRTELRKELPDIKFSVTTHLFSMGAEINIKCKEIPEYYVITDFEHFKLQHHEVFTLFNGEPYDSLQEQNIETYTNMFNSDKCYPVKINKRLLAKVESIVNKYHTSESDYWGDYYNCNFYYHIRWDDAVII